MITDAGLTILLTLKSKALFMLSVLLYVVSKITWLSTVSISVTLNSDQPLILSAFVSAVNVILMFSVLLMTMIVSLVKGGVIIAKLSCEYMRVSGGFPFPPVTLSSLPQAANNPAKINMAKSIAIEIINRLRNCSGFSIVLFIINKFDLLKNNKNIGIFIIKNQALSQNMLTALFNYKL
jgi:hypothetical protein